jgi:hypothetical protein
MAPEFYAADTAAQSSEAVLMTRVSTAVHKNINLGFAYHRCVFAQRANDNIHELGFWQEKKSDGNDLIAGKTE